MASISIYFRNGDFVSLGCTLEFANIAYNALVNEDEGFVTLGVVENMPRFAIRTADVIAVVVLPNDTTTVFLSSAAVRSVEVQSKIPPPQQPQPATATQAEIVPEEQPAQEPQYRNGNDLGIL